ncbi:hypothetical protein ACOSZF_00515 [Cytobacillus firmus]|uniref:hypothetical protein n=1 Tax=Cytobacillus firmus TaxID=1399 RepID=UPI00077CD8B2|nr:hypothetical protein [Cytobacillus firmus]MBG9542010.1 hypothetical protein [Cytobacillus firmus]MBG9551676.1 hypothetical protein [Cytobacillus firmus]MBG9556251.1 hypothetical protein [Cytobacillus firmus]MBG9576093.1 hypothetical protein [Cytobacillus firmus]MEC1895210.1 hypothetical protein [Cytobacillus firmus]
MGHEIYGWNKAREEIAYARFSMGNSNAILLYGLLDANQFYAGVSGSGKSSIFSLQQFEKALNEYKKLFNTSASLVESDCTSWDQKQILHFIQNCLATAQKEKSVEVYFG